MSRSLYFIPLISKALSQSNQKEALIGAFQKIESIARVPGYENGFEMFSSFMAEITENWKFQDHLRGETAANVIEDFILQLSAETLKKDISSEKFKIDGTDLSPGLLEYLEHRIRTSSAIDTMPPQAELDVIRDGKVVATIQLVSKQTFYRINDIEPGCYAFSLLSGRLLWEVKLTEKDLLLTAADPGTNLRLAADTGEKRQLSPSREMAVLDGELIFRVFPGLENGWIEIAKRHLR